jgi:hypothetical protein
MEPLIQNRSLGIMPMTIIIDASIVVVISITEFGSFGIAQGQGSTKSTSSSSLSLTPQQKAAICDPNNPKLKVVNTTESKICGIPITVEPHLTSSNMTTGAQAPPRPLAPPSG